MIEVEFIADFATKKKGEVWKCDGMLASHLVNIDKVAKYVGKADGEKPKPKRTKKE